MHKWKGFTRTTAWKLETQFFSSKFEIESWLILQLLPKSWNHLSFVNISPTLVIDTWMEKSSQVLQHRIVKIWISFKKIQNWILTCSWTAEKKPEFTLASSISVLHWLMMHEWKGFHKFSIMINHKFDFIKKKERKTLSWVYLLSCFVSNF